MTIRAEETGRCSHCNTMYRILASDNMKQNCPYCNHEALPRLIDNSTHSAYSAARRDTNKHSKRPKHTTHKTKK